jgi:uncharacterized protein (DUF1015 family)
MPFGVARGRARPGTQRLAGAARVRDICRICAIDAIHAIHAIHGIDGVDGIDERRGHLNVADVRPFKALRYDTAQVALSDVIVPPYDVITADERVALYERDPHSAVRLELTRDVGDEAGTHYTHVSETLRDWQREGVLVRDSTPALYALRQEFTAPDGESRRRDGFFAALRLEDYDARVVRPHERTLAGPKADRLRVMRAAGATLSPIFMLYEDREDELGALLASAVEVRSAAERAEAAGVSNQLAPLADPDLVRQVEDFMAERPLVIADGHHRYETCLAYRDERRAAAGTIDRDAHCESALVYLANAYSPGSLLLPIHRVIRKAGVPTDKAWSERLPGWNRKSVSLGREPSAGMLRQMLAEHLEPLARHPAFAADDASGDLQIFWRDEPLGDDLMVRILEEKVIGAVFELDADSIRQGAVSFPKSAERAAAEVRAGEGTVALYLNGMEPEDVFRVTEAGEVMPQKSTFFAPKIPTGLVFRVEDQA